MTPLQNQNIPPKSARSFWEVRHSEIITITRRVTVIISRFFPLSIVLGGLCKLRDGVITLLPEKMAIRLDSRRMLIRIIREMPAGERVDFARSMLELIPQIDQDTKNAFIETVAANLGNDEGLVRSILPFVTTKMYSSNNIKITQKITDIPINERIEVIRASNLLINPEMKAYNIFEIVREVANIPANQREEVIEISQLLIIPKMSVHDITLIIRAVANIPADQREEVIETSQLLITPKMSAVKIATIIRAVAGI